MTAPLLDRLPPLGEQMLASDAIFDRFLDYTIEAGFELYEAQEEALLEILSGKNVVLATPTGSGKSLVALALHFKAMCEDKRSFYTSPVKALVNEKFFALCDVFHPDNVGLMTGDATVNRDAPIICCTAEILANMGLREGEDADVSYVVMDEFHFYGDRDRGVAWQLPLLTLPQTRFLLMSATLGDMETIETAMTDLNGAPSVTVRSDRRPVPLDFQYWEVSLHDAVDQLVEDGLAPVYVVNFTQRACHDVAQSLTSINVSTKVEKKAIQAAMVGFRFDTPYGKTLKRFLRHGIGVHHGGMLPKYRRMVERLAKQGLLRVISGTDTLGVGVNVPIRTVLLTQLCKYDGRNTRILSVRDFKQICGRAGRRGYDDKGTVVALAPEHVVDNLKLEAKAGGDPKKLRKMVKKKPPTWGYAHWDEATFNKLRRGRPETLKSRFRVSHGMLLDVLSRPDGCAAMKHLLRSNHESDHDRHRHAKQAIGMFRALVEANVIALEPQEGTNVRQVQINRDLQREFSLFHALSLFLVESLRILDPTSEDYPLDLLSFVEAILEDPTILLRKQLDRIKGEKVGQMKADGLDYEERMAELDQLDVPRPNAALIEGAFDAFVETHPWLARESIRPKGVARDLYERALDLRSYIVDAKLERSEGVVLRYFTEVYKTLTQSVPSWAVTEEVREMAEFFEAVVRGVDASLLEEWLQLRDPDYVPPRPLEDEPAEEVTRGVTADVRSFTVLVRNAAFRVVAALARRDYEAALGELVTGATPEGSDEPWTVESIAAALTPYFEEHEAIRTDPKARSAEYFLVEREADRWRVTQRLVDPEAFAEWALALEVDLEASDEEGKPMLSLRKLVH